MAVVAVCQTKGMKATVATPAVVEVEVEVEETMKERKPGREAKVLEGEGNK